MAKKFWVFVFFVLAVSLGAAGQKVGVRPSQHTPARRDGIPPDGLIFNRVLKSTSVSFGSPIVSEPAGYANIDSPVKFTCVGPTTCTLSAEIKVQVIANFSNGNGVALCSQVDGQFMEEPESCPYLADLPGDGAFHALDWTANMSKVAPGKHTLQSQIYSDQGIGLFEYEITYRLYKP